MLINRTNYVTKLFPGTRNQSDNSGETQTYFEMVQGLPAMSQLSTDFTVRDNQQHTYEWWLTKLNNMFKIWDIIFASTSRSSNYLFMKTFPSFSIFSSISQYSTKQNSIKRKDIKQLNVHESLHYDIATKTTNKIQHYID